MKTEKGAASILIDLSSGNITVYHGTEQDAILLSKKNVPEGTWNAIWNQLRSIDEQHTREELEQMNNEQLGELYEQTIGYNPFEDNAQINPKTGRAYYTPEETRKDCIEILSETE